LAGKKGRTGKTKAKHGGYLFLHTGELPPEKHHIELKLNRTRQGLIDTLGGDERVSDGQLILIDQITQFTGFLDLIHLFLKQGSSPPFYLKGGRLHVQPALSTFYLACANSISRNIERLGLNKQRVRKIPELREYIEIHSKKGGGESV